MSFKQNFKRALSLPPHVVLIKIFEMLTFRAKARILEVKDHFVPTYCTSFCETTPQPVFPTAPSVENLKTNFSNLDALLAKVMEHEFDLLGSGWVKVHHNMQAKGLSGISYPKSEHSAPVPSQTQWVEKSINPANISTAKQIWKQVSSGYRAIDWHLDFKSGYRWKQNTWWFRIPYGHKAAVDIKVPWEVSRGQHLPLLSFGYATSDQMEKAEIFANEFRDQILDFCANNPPRFGVNWRCAMDVSIRAANWILTYDFFRCYGKKFDKSFTKILLNSLFDHGNFIYKNLEIGKDGFRGNHFLADICGLAYISCFLPETPETNKWFKFSYQAFLKEMDYQFFDDGANFEGSTAYHRLSAEMMLYTTMLFSAQKKRRHAAGLTVAFSDTFMRKLYQMKFFAQTVTLPNGNISQVGDCDSGRFFKIQPLFKDGHLLEKHLDFTCLIDSIEAFFSKAATPGTVESDWISTMNLTESNSPVTNQYQNFYDKNSIEKFLSFSLFDKLKNIANGGSEALDTGYSIQVKDIKIPNINSQTSLFLYKDFGLVGWKSENFYLGFRCGPIGQKGRGGHDHNDQLSLEIFANGSPIISDPGTAIYTAFPDIRNRYRSIKAHFSPQVVNEREEVIEPAPLDQGLFSLNNGQASHLLVAEENTLVGFNPKLKTCRIIRLKHDLIRIVDVCIDRKWTIIENQAPPSYSSGYGLY